MYTTFLASSFRSIRFGLTEAHGRGIAVQLNTPAGRGRVQGATPDGTFAVDRGRIKARGGGADARDHDPAGRGRRGQGQGAADAPWRVVRPPVQRVLDRLTAVPVDIEPRFTTAEPPGLRPQRPSAARGRVTPGSRDLRPVVLVQDRAHVVDAGRDPDALGSGVRVVDAAHDRLRHARVVAVRDGEQRRLQPCGRGDGVHVLRRKPARQPATASAIRPSGTQVGMR